MPIPNIFAKIFSTGAKDVLDSVGSIIDSVVTTKEEKEALKMELQKEINRSMEAMADKALKEAEIQVADITSARAREVELAKAGLKDKTPKILSIVAITGFFSILLFLLIFGFGSLTADQGMIVGTLLGTLGGLVSMVYAYYFGSSVGSKNKEIELTQIRKKLENDKP